MTTNDTPSNVMPTNHIKPFRIEYAAGDYADFVAAPSAAEAERFWRSLCTDHEAEEIEVSDIPDTATLHDGESTADPLITMREAIARETSFPCLLASTEV